MPGEKLLSLLKSFSKPDFKGFKKYVQSPFFNENQDLVELYTYIETTLRGSKVGSEDTLLEKSVVWKILYPRKKYDDALMRRLSSDLTGLIQDFLGWQEFRKDPFNPLIYQLRAHNSLTLQKHFNGILREIEDYKSGITLRNADFHFAEYQVEQIRHRHLELSESKAKAANLKHLQSSDYHLDCLYISRKLRNFCNLLGLQQSLSVTADISLMPGFLEYVSRSHYMEEPCVKSYYLVAQMLLEPDDEVHYRELKDLLMAQYECFPHSEQNTLYTHLKNYCIDTKINKGRSDYFAELFEIYKTSLEKAIIFENGVLPELHYKNMVTIGLKIRDFDWTEKFIERYTDFLPEVNKDNARRFNLAKVYFSQSRYEKVVEQLSRVEYDNLTYALGGKMMLLETYYELSEYKALDSLLESFRIYLIRNKLISKELQQQYLNVIRFTRRLTSLPPYDRKAIEKLKVQILDCKNIAAKDWLLRKLEEMG